jgi:F-type H+-transporting ATPase subunit alpha
MVEILKQGQYVPMPVERQVVVIFAATNGYIDRVPSNKIGEFETQLFSFLERKHPSVLTDIVTKKQIDGDVKAKLEAALKEFEKEFVA